MRHTITEAQFMKISNLLLLATLALVPAMTLATTPAPEQSVAQTPDEDLTMADYLLLRSEQMRDAEAGRYGRIKRDDMKRLRDAHATLQRLLAGREDALELGPSERVELFNAQEVMRAILTQQNESALICEHRRPMGSQIVQARCVSRADAERRRLSEEEAMRRFTYNVQAVKDSGPDL